MHRISFAPELSATLRRVSCWITLLLRLLHDFEHAPALLLGDGARLGDADQVADTALVLLVVHLELRASLDGLAVQAVAFDVPTWTMIVLFILSAIPVPSRTLRWPRDSLSVAAVFVSGLVAVAVSVIWFPQLSCGCAWAWPPAPRVLLLLVPPPAPLAPAPRRPARGRPQRARRRFQSRARAAR